MTCRVVTFNYNIAVCLSLIWNCIKHYVWRFLSWLTAFGNGSRMGTCLEKHCILIIILNYIWESLSPNASFCRNNRNMCVTEVEAPVSHCNRNVPRRQSNWFFSTINCLSTRCNNLAVRFTQQLPFRKHKQCSQSMRAGVLRHFHSNATWSMVYP